MKKIEIWLYSVLLVLFSTQTVFGLSLDFSDSSFLMVGRAIALIVFVKVFMGVTEMGINRFKSRKANGSYGGDKGLRKAQRAQNRANKKNKRSRVYGGYDSNGVAADLSDKAFEAMIDLGYGVRRAGAWVGKQVTKPFRWFKNRAGMAKDLVVAAKAPTVSNIAKAGGTLAGGINNERKIIMGTDKESKRRTESLKAKQERAKAATKAQADNIRESQGR